MFFVLQTSLDIKPDIDKLINQYSQRLVRLSYMILKDTYLAEEAAWDTLYRAYNSYSQFRRESSESTWITSIAINVCKGYMRKSSYKEIASSDFISLDYASEDELLAEFQNAESVDLLNAVYCLSGKYKEVILLRYYQQMNVSEISKLLKEKENTISVRIKRAHELLRKMLKEE